MIYQSEALHNIDNTRPFIQTPGFPYQGLPPLGHIFFFSRAGEIEGNTGVYIVHFDPSPSFFSTTAVGGGGSEDPPAKTYRVLNQKRCIFKALFPVFDVISDGKGGGGVGRSPREIF